VDFWLDKFAPEGVRFTLYDSPPSEEIENLTPDLIGALKAMKEDFRSVEWNAESIHNTIYEGSRSRNIDPKTTFRAFYRILLGRDRGPRLGFFLSTLDKQDVLRKLSIAIGEPDR
jgi:lysyl-tRNA synthetase class 1